MRDRSQARVVARSGELVQGTSTPWHSAPDGGACYLANDGGYVYVSNSETLVNAGASALLCVLRARKARAPAQVMVVADREAAAYCVASP